MGKVLDKINKANDIKRIPKKYYPKLAEEIREFLIDTVSSTGGHLASNLGAVELTIALHSVMNLPKDKIVWDVGHQAYTHKILTGRKDDFQTLRKIDGMSGFPKRHESECDSFDTGHSSTSVSAALGMAMAAQLNHSKEKIVAVIGDGALTGGMALEALNNVAALKRNMIIIINDNEMSISQNVGGMSNYLNKLRVGEHYNDFKSDVERSLNKIPKVGNALVKKVKRTKDNIKNLFIQGGLFDDLGITYIGPIDGHDIEGMMRIFEKAFKIDHPLVIHVKTKKGKGYSYAEQYPERFHGIDSFDKETGESLNKNKMLSYTDVFSKTLVKMAKNDDRIVAITAAMPDGTGLSRFQKEYPERFFDVGIAEQHAVTFAAGLATMGYYPFISIYSSFYQRAYDQIVHDVCIQNLPMTLIVDRAGLVGKDGETHQGIFDISFLSAMPNMTIIAPKDLKELIEAMKYSRKNKGPVAIRFSRGVAYTKEQDNYEFVPGKSEILEQGKKVALIAVGNMVEECEKAVDLLKEKGITPTFVNARFLKPIDIGTIRQTALSHDYVIVVEEGIKKGGFGESVETYVMEQNIDSKVETMAIEDVFVSHGSVPELRKRLGIDAQSICEKVMEKIQ